jgi:biotin transport system substrate-specific component
LSTRDMTRAALLASLAVVAAQVARFGSAVVPFSLLPAVAMLAGCLGGPKVGAMSMLLYAGLGLAGLPVFATAPFGGPAYLLKPTFGFVVGFVACAWGAGMVCRGSRATRHPSRTRCVGASLVGMVLIYAIGVPYLWMILDVYLGGHVGLGGAIRIGLAPFIGADALKAVGGGLVSAEVLRRLPVSVDQLTQGGDAIG